jgi:hypothetical protein
VAAATGAVLEQVTVPATPAGDRQLLRLADRYDGGRVWAIEGTGGYGAGLTRFLSANHEQVVELDRPKRTARRHGAKSDPLDAIRAACEALGRDQLAQPRAAGLLDRQVRQAAMERPFANRPPRPPRRARAGVGDRTGSSCRSSCRPSAAIAPASPMPATTSGDSSLSQPDGRRRRRTNRSPR